MTDSDIERTIVVDENDTVMGEEEKEKCHKGDGVLHRGFLVMVFNDSGQLLLTRRSDRKKLWPGSWEGSVAGHVLAGEDYVGAAQRRLRQELGINAEDIEFAFKFRYQAAYGALGREHEICAVTIVRGIAGGALPVNRNEISAIRFVDFKALIEELRENGGNYTPRLVLALEHISERPIVNHGHCDIHARVPC